MIHPLQKILILFGILYLSACATGGGANPQDLASADYGAYPADYEAIIKNYFNTTLKDPFSAHYQFEKPFKAYLRNAPIVGGQPRVFGYMVYTAVNAKNSFGAYVGWKSYRLLIRNGVVVGAATSNPWFNEAWYN